VAAGIYRAEIELYTETGSKLGCVRAFTRLDASNIDAATKKVEGPIARPARRSFARPAPSHLARGNAGC